MAIRWTHVTVPVRNLDASILFFVDVCGLSIVRDRRLEGGGTVWLGPTPATHAFPEFVVVLVKSDIAAPLDHFGFQCDSRQEVTAIAERANVEGNLVEGPTDEGGSVGYFAVVREPGGHLVEFTYGQPLLGLTSRLPNAHAA